MIIAKHGEIEIHAPEDTWYSFFNSPYVGHREGSAIDIYFPEEALFPVEEGVVEMIRRVNPPQRYVKGGDFLTIFRVSDNICLKILHVASKVKIGEKLALGDPIGEQIISGFFMPWSSKHAHVELRRCEDSIRARGGLPLRPIIVNNVPIAHGNEFEIVESSENFCWAVPRKTHGRSMTPIAFKGHGIEGGLPHYEYGAVFSNVDSIHLFGHTVEVTKFTDRIGFFKTDFQILVNNRRVRGIGVYCNQPKIKIIKCSFEKGEEVRISIHENKKSERVQ